MFGIVQEVGDVLTHVARLYDDHPEAKGAGILALVAVSTLTAASRLRAAFARALPGKGEEPKPPPKLRVKTHPTNGTEVEVG